MPTIEKLHKAHRDRGLVVLGIDKQDSAAAVRAVYKQSNLTFPTAVDLRGDVSSHYGVNAIPTTIIYNRKGKVVARIVGTRDEQQFLQLLKKAGLK